MGTSTLTVVARVAAFSACLAVAGCSASERARGVRAEGVLSEVSALRVSAQPFLEIRGQSEQDSLHLLDVSDAVLLPDGRIVVANAGEYELLVFDSTGRFIRRLGRKGDGPGEFAAGVTPRLYVTGDALWATTGVGRVNRYALPSLELTSTEALGVVGEQVRVALAGAFSDGGLLLSSYPVAPPESTAGTDPKQPRIRLARAEQPSGPAFPLATVRDVARYTHNSGRITSSPAVPVLGRDVYAVGDSALVVVPTDSGIARFIGVDGTLLEALRWNPDQIPAEEAWRLYAAGAERRARGLPPPLIAHEIAFFDREIKLPKLAAAYRTIRVDSRGAVWLGRIDWSESQRNAWDVIDPRQRSISRVELPPGVRPQVITERTLVSLAIDAQGAESVKLFAVQRFVVP
jgi:hypothetical protein